MKPNDRKPLLYCRKCGDFAVARGLCRKHWKHVRTVALAAGKWVPLAKGRGSRTKPTTSTPTPTSTSKPTPQRPVYVRGCMRCGRTIAARGYCDTHYKLFRNAAVAAGTWRPQHGGGTGAYVPPTPSIPATPEAAPAATASPTSTVTMDLQRLLDNAVRELQKTKTAAYADLQKARVAARAAYKAATSSIDVEINKIRTIRRALR